MFTYSSESMITTTFSLLASFIIMFSSSLKLLMVPYASPLVFVLNLRAGVNCRGYSKPNHKSYLVFDFFLFSDTSYFYCEELFDHYFLYAAVLQCCEVFFAEFQDIILYSI